MVVKAIIFGGETHPTPKKQKKTHLKKLFEISYGSTRVTNIFVLFFKLPLEAKPLEARGVSVCYKEEMV